MRISDWSSDVCSSDLPLYHSLGVAVSGRQQRRGRQAAAPDEGGEVEPMALEPCTRARDAQTAVAHVLDGDDRIVAHALILCVRMFLSPVHSTFGPLMVTVPKTTGTGRPARSEEHTSELKSLMRNSSSVFCLKK